MTVQAGDRPVREAVLLAPSQEDPVVLSYSSLRWHVIRRGERYAVGLHDLESPLVREFAGIKTFPESTNWRLEACLEPRLAGHTIPVTDITGASTHQPSPGTLAFRIGGHTYRLDAVEEEGQLFVIFADQANGHETYGSGRFVYAPPPDPQGRTELDFNKAYNPPCAFTAFSTCPLPPRQNKLPVRVEAGEKAFLGL